MLNCGALAFPPARFEGKIPLDLVETANQLIQSSRGLGRNLPARTLVDMAAMVRLMNSYYSNRIDGNSTRPRDIKRALAGDFDADPGRRAQQQEHAAHVRLQEEIDPRAAEGTLQDPTDPAFIRWLHLSFYEDAAEAMPQQCAAPSVRICHQGPETSLRCLLGRPAH